MMLKCGQKDNARYTFGLRKEQIEDNIVDEKKSPNYRCVECGSSFSTKVSYCSCCGNKIS